MFSAEDYKTLLKEGVIRKELNIGGVVFTVRLLSMKDILVSDTIVDFVSANARTFASPLNLSLETLVRLAFIVEKIDNEELKPAITQEHMDSIIDSLMGIGNDTRQEFMKEVIKPRISRLTSMTPSIIETLVEEYQKLRNEVTEFIKKEGGLPN